MSRKVARRVALGAQGFADAPVTGVVTKRHMTRVMKRMRVLQLDSIPVVIRTQYMPFHSRLGPYNPDLLDRIAYRDGDWFEVWAHEACLLPVESEPLMRWTFDRAREGKTWKHLYELSVREPAYVQSVLDEVRERGSVTGGTLSDPRPRKRDASGWGSSSLGVVALDWLFRVGELGIRRQGNFEKLFVPMESVIPQAIRSQPTPTPDDAFRELMVQSVQAHGIGTAHCIADYFRMPIRQARTALAELVEDGRVVPATVNGWPEPAFADPEARAPRRITGATVLSPFDPVVWNRRRGEMLWDFDYRIEIYVPKAKRRYGYYVLPVMVDGEIVARVDVKTDRAESVLRVLSSHVEGGRNTASMAERVAPALNALAQTVGVESVEVVDRGDFAPHLRAAVSTSVKVGPTV